MRRQTLRQNLEKDPRQLDDTADPDRQITASPPAFVVLGPIGQPMLLLRDLITMIGVELVRHLQHPQEKRPQPISVDRGSMQQRQASAHFLEMIGCQSFDGCQQ
jgi:hypothetical protein